MIRPRYGAGSSNSPRGLFLTGGVPGSLDDTLPPVNTTEILVDGTWEPGPDLPSPLVNHCQVTVGQTIYIAGIYQREKKICISYMPLYFRRDY